MRRSKKISSFGKEEYPSLGEGEVVGLFKSLNLFPLYQKRGEVHSAITNATSRKKKHSPSFSGKPISQYPMVSNYY
jgi:hypothetical protein